MDWVEIAAGVIFLLGTPYYRWTMPRIRARVVARGEDPAAFDRWQQQWWMRATMWAAPIVGVLVIVAGVLGE